MRKNPGVYDSTFKYIVAHLQKQMKIMFNPIYDQVLPTEHSELHFWTLDKKSKKMKKTFKTASDFKYFPKEICIETEEQKMNRARERLKARQNPGGVKIEKKDIVISAKKDETPIENEKIEPSKLISGEANILQPPSKPKKDDKKGKTATGGRQDPPKKKPIFEVLEEKTDFEGMIKASKVVDGSLEMKILLEDYDSIGELNVDVSESKILITDPSL